MVAHNRMLKSITLLIDAVAYECQVTSWKINPPAKIAGDKVWTFCPGGEFREEVDQDDWTVDLTWVSDWRVAGLNRILWANRGLTKPIVLTNHSDRPGEAVRWTGEVYIEAPAVGGDARTTEMSEITLIGVGDIPVPSYPVVV